MTISKYLTEIENSLQFSGARSFYFPMDKALRKERNFRLAHEIGYGLAVYEDWKDYAGTLYGRMVVKNSFDSTGVVINNKQWITEINNGIKKEKSRNKSNA